MLQNGNYIAIINIKYYNISKFIVWSLHNFCWVVNLCFEIPILWYNQLESIQYEFFKTQNFLELYVELSKNSICIFKPCIHMYGIMILTIAVSFYKYVYFCSPHSHRHNICFFFHFKIPLFQKLLRNHFYRFIV